MSSSLSPKLPTQRSRINGSLRLRNQEFPFYLVHQKVDLEPAGVIQFYYMPPAKLRGGDPERDVSNFRSCVGYWYAAMQEIGEATDREQQRHYLMALSYALFNRDKGPQSVFRDAFLRSGAFRIQDVSLPDDVRSRIRRAVRDRDRDAVKREMDNALAATKHDRGDLLGYQEAFGIWIDEGVSAMRRDGEDGIVRWLKEIDYWNHRYRKRCPPRVRGFINFFAYQAKVSFYTCYANFWASLIPWLLEHYDLDEPSRRFLSLWHNQNQPIEIPHGRTRGGIVYPTTGGTSLILPDGQGGFASQTIGWKSARIGPAHVPDVFASQVLALHPLSWILLSDPALRIAVGRCIASPCFHGLLREGSVELFGEYWGMVDAILTAAHLYRRARDHYENRRGVREAGDDTTRSVAGKAESPSPDAFFTAYVRDRNLRCDCGACFEYHGLASDTEEDREDCRELLLQCVCCPSQKRLTVTEQEITSYLTRECL